MGMGMWMTRKEMRVYLCKRTGLVMMKLKLKPDSKLARIAVGGG